MGKKLVRCSFLINADAKNRQATYAPTLHLWNGTVYRVHSSEYPTTAHSKKLTNLVFRAKNVAWWRINQMPFVKWLFKVKKRLRPCSSDSKSLHFGSAQEYHRDSTKYESRNFEAAILIRYDSIGAKRRFEVELNSPRFIRIDFLMWWAAKCILCCGTRAPESPWKPLSLLWFFCITILLRVMDGEAGLRISASTLLSPNNNRRKPLS